MAAGVVGRWVAPALAAARPELVQELQDVVAATPAEGYASCCDALAEIAEGVAFGQFLVLTEAAHLADLEQPAAVTAALLTHLDARGGTDAGRHAQGRGSCPPATGCHPSASSASASGSAG